MAFHVGIDVGGTFTDFALFDDASGQIRLGKVLTTPDDPSRAVLAGLDKLLADASITARKLARAIHATTIATNTVIQRHGPKTALLTTAGFRDVLMVGRQKRWDLYDNELDKPVPIVPRRLIWEAPERTLHDGSIHRALDERAVRRVARQMKAEGVASVAICFLHAYANPLHERRAGELIAEEAPDIAISLSSEVSPVYREYERSNTTALNAYVMPAVSAYIRRLEQGLKRNDFKGRLLVMQSNGGVATPEVVERFPIRVIESGPAAGVLTAARHAVSAGTDNLLSFDMGGTTAKICLIEGGQPALTGQFEVDMVRLKKNSGLPINITAIDLVEIGSGGGSIARVELGAIAVGPESAGSVPGPVCYARGGQRVTVTDADLLLGYLNADYFLGGTMKLDKRAAQDAIAEQIAAPLGLDPVEAAWGVHEVVTAQMAQAARVVSVGQGKDPRHFTQIPFGGAGPVHGARLARMLGCARAVFPFGAGVETAIGLLMGDPSFDLARTRITPLAIDQLDSINEIVLDLERQGRAQLAACGLSRGMRIVRSADMRFSGQGYEINVALPSGHYRKPDIARLRQRFFDAYATTYGDCSDNDEASVEIVHYRVTASCPGPALALHSIPHGDEDPQGALKGYRRVYFPESRGFTRTPVFDRDRLEARDRFEGPAIVEERESTIVIPPRSRALVDERGNIILDLD
jgi:N-methylhydantoinase A